MTALYGLGLLLLGCGCCLAARVELDADNRRRRVEMERLRDRGDHAGVIREACRPPTHGGILVVLCAGGGLLIAQGFVELFGALMS